jgi:TolB-like protein
VLLQIAATVAPILDLPGWFEKSVLLFLAIGFPVAVILAWAFDLTATGIKRDPGGGTKPGVDRRFRDTGLILVLLLAVGFFVVDKYFAGSATTEQGAGNSIAVLPFANMSQDESNEPFTAGIHDDLLTHMSRIRSIRTISRTSVLQYRDTNKTVPEIAAELGVATILEGGVQRSGDRVRINVQLIDAASDEHLWAETYDRELTAANVFDIQSNIARMIASQLRATLTEDEEQTLDAIPTHDIAALDSYFIGKQLLELRTRESLTAAVEYFELVVALDPDFALAWSGLADAYMLLPEYSALADREMSVERSTYAVERALALDGNLPYVSSSAAWAKLIHDYDWIGAEDTFRRALEIEPDNTNVLHWLSHTLSWQGRHREALVLARRAHDLEPDSNLMTMNLAYILVDAREFVEALQIVRTVRQRASGYTAARRNLYLHELRAGNIEAGAAAFVEYTDITGGEAVAASEIGEMFVAYARPGTVGALSDDLIARTRLGSEDLAQVLAFIGDAEGTLAALQQAIDDRSGSRSVLSMKINPGYDFIRDDPRFESLLNQAGLSN